MNWYNIRKGVLKRLRTYDLNCSGTSDVDTTLFRLRYIGTTQWCTSSAILAFKTLTACLKNGKKSLHKRPTTRQTNPNHRIYPIKIYDITRVIIHKYCSHPRHKRTSLSDSYMVHVQAHYFQGRPLSSIIIYICNRRYVAQMAIYTTWW